MAKCIPLRKYVVFEERFESCLKEENPVPCLSSLAKDIECYLVNNIHDTESILILADIYESLDNLPKAIEVVEKARKENTDIRLLLKLVILYNSSLDFKRALDLISQLEEKQLPKKARELLTAYKLLLMLNTKDYRAMKKAIRELKEEGKDVKSLLFSHLPSELASTIIRSYRGFVEGENLLREKPWLQEVLDKIKESFKPRNVLVVAHSDYEYPEWVTPVILVYMDLPELPEKELIKWKLNKEEEIIDTVQHLLREGVVVKVKEPTEVPVCH